MEGDSLPIHPKVRQDINEAMEKGGIDRLPSKSEGPKDPINIIVPPYAYGFHDLEQMYHRFDEEDVELYGNLRKGEVRQPVGSSYEWIRRYEKVEQNYQNIIRGLAPEQIVELLELKDRFLDTIRYEMMIKDGDNLKISEIREVFRYAQKTFDAFLQAGVISNLDGAIFGISDIPIIDALGRALTVVGDPSSLSYQVRYHINEALS